MLYEITSSFMFGLMAGGIFYLFKDNGGDQEYLILNENREFLINQILVRMMNIK